MYVSAFWYLGETHKTHIWRCTLALYLWIALCDLKIKEIQLFSFLERTLLVNSFVLFEFTNISLRHHALRTFFRMIYSRKSNCFYGLALYRHFQIWDSATQESYNAKFDFSCAFVSFYYITCWMFFEMLAFRTKISNINTSLSFIKAFTFDVVI